MDHPLRSVLIEEVHARPFAVMEPPEHASHLAFVSGEEGDAEDFAHLVRLCQCFGIPLPIRGVRHFSFDFGSFRLKWERHGEFCTYSFFFRAQFAHPFSVSAISHVPADWLEAIPGKRLVAVHLAVEPFDGTKRTAAELAPIFATQTLCGSQVLEGAALVWTDFAVHEDGFGRILVRDVSLGSSEVGRLVQRLLEIETYRMMALIGLPLVQEYGPKIRQIEHETAEIAKGMSDVAGIENTRAMLSRLSRLSAQVEGITARLIYRIDATRAYFALVRRRVERLREERLEGLQTIEEFMERRLSPAMQTCETVARRLESVSRRLARAGDLLRTLVDVGLQEQNRDILLSMDRRARLQSRLQRILEVISIVALTYYLTVLLITILEALKAAGVPLDVELMAGGATPFLLGIIWLIVRWTRQTVIRKHEREH